MKISPKELSASLGGVALLSTGIGILIGALITVDAGEYGPVDELRYKDNHMCRVYHRQEAEVILCNGEIYVEGI